MLVLRSEPELAPFHGCALVPTMGALHEGHASLIRQAAGTGKRVVATVFVNPTQFGPKEDFAKYPRTLEADLRIAETAGANAVFAPDATTVYPEGAAAAQQQASVWPVPAVGTAPKLEDGFRPHHFGGVCQVVARLFDLTLPSVAIFGEKDYQQLRVLTDMVTQSNDRWGALTVLPGATVRESDGLALSSRNRYLRPEQRSQALGLSRALKAANDCPTAAAAETAMQQELARSGLQVDYAVVRHAHTLLPLDAGAPSGGNSAPARALIAARLDTVRLIDNAPWQPRLASSARI